MRIREIPRPAGTKYVPGTDELTRRVGHRVRRARIRTPLLIHSRISRSGMTLPDGHVSTASRLIHAVTRRLADQWRLRRTPCRARSRWLTQALRIWQRSLQLFAQVSSLTFPNEGGTMSLSATLRAPGATVEPSGAAERREVEGTRWSSPGDARVANDDNRYRNAGPGGGGGS
jgi:hypothetical protein